MFFRRKKKLFEYDPKVLDLESLRSLQASLIAKLILANTELQTRWRNIALLSGDLNETGLSRKSLTEAADRLDHMNAVLTAELARITRPEPELSLPTEPRRPASSPEDRES